MDPKQERQEPDQRLRLQQSQLAARLVSQLWARGHCVTLGPRVYKSRV